MTSYSKEPLSRPGAPQAERIVGLLEGTQILTRKGYRPVQTLRKGDQVLTLMARTSLFSPITWIGMRTLRSRRHADTSLVRIRKYAIADDMPLQDIWLAPEHGIYMEGAFFLPRHLVNNGSLLIEDGAHRRLWAIKLPLHDVIVAEGLPVESFLGEAGSCGFTEVAEAAASNVISHVRFNPAHRAAAG